MRRTLCSLAVTATLVGGLVLPSWPAAASDATAEPSPAEEIVADTTPIGEEVPVEPTPEGAPSELKGDLDGELSVLANGSVEFSVPISDGMTGLDLTLPELKCPASAPHVESAEYDPMAGYPVELPLGLQASGNGRRIGHATWKPHAMNDRGLAFALGAGSLVELDGLRPEDGRATFTLHCTEDPSRAVGLGRLAEPSPIRIGGQVEQQLSLQPGVWISEVRDLPSGLVLDRSGVLSGKVLPTAARDQAVTVVLTNGIASLEQRITLKITGETIMQLTQTWKVTEWRPISLGGQIVCPPDHPWTTAQKWHSDDAVFAERVPRGVQIISHGWVGVDSMAVYQGSLGRGMTNVTAWNRQPFGIESALHFRLHCTNDSNQASRR